MVDVIARAIFIIALPLLALTLIAGLGQLVLSWRHRHDPPIIICPECEGRCIIGRDDDDEPFAFECNTCWGKGVITKGEE